MAEDAARGVREAARRVRAMLDDERDDGARRGAAAGDGGGRDKPGRLGPARDAGPARGTGPASDAARLSPRQRGLLDLVRERGFATVEGLAGALGVSAQTARREVIRLDALGLLQRFHGGAGAPEGFRGPAARPAYRDKRARDAPAKARIGRAVAAMVAPGALVFLDVGTTCEAVARALRGLPSLRVVTCSLPAAMALAGSGAEVIVTGGALRGADGSLAGAAALAALADLRADLAVIGFSGVEPDGAVTDFDPEKVAVKRAALAGARRAVAAGTAGKLSLRAPVLVAPAARFEALVLDAEPAPGRRAALEAVGGRLAVALA